MKQFITIQTFKEISSAANFRVFFRQINLHIFCSIHHFWLYFPVLPLRIFTLFIIKAKTGPKTSDKK